MGTYLTRRAVHSFFALAGLLVLVFFLARLTGDPGYLYLPLDATLDARQEFSEKHGFNDPIYVQFGRFLVQLSFGDLGDSLMKARPALDVVLEAFWVTLSLAVAVIPIALIGSVVIGALAAYRPGGLFDRVATIAALLGASAPDFWVAITGIIVFCDYAGVAADFRLRGACHLLGHARGGAAGAPVWTSGAGHSGRDAERVSVPPSSRRRGPRGSRNTPSSSCTRCATPCCP